MGNPHEGAARDDLVDHAVVAGLLGPEDEVALRVRVDPLDRLPGVLGQDLLDAAALAGDLGARFRLRPRPMTEAMRWMAHVGGGWDERLEALRAHLARRRS